MMKTIQLIAIAAVTACIFTLSADAQTKKMYSYTDENGTVVFTDQPPEGREVQSQAVPAGPPPQGANPYADAGQQTEPSAAQLRREEIANNRQQARTQQAENEAQCAAWQAEVETLEPHRRHFYTNEEGETERMDDVERVNRVAELKEKIAANCK